MTTTGIAGFTAALGWLGLAIGAHAQEPAPPEVPSGVIELRQYKIVPGQRDAMIALFEANLIEGQEAAGMRLLGQFRDLDDRNRFTWIRGFSDMASRKTALETFYGGPVWQANRERANPLLEDNDNVLLLRPATDALALAGAARASHGPRATDGEDGIVVANILYLWKDPGAGFADFFRERLVPELTAAGLPVLGAYVREPTPNDFPRLPVRQQENVFVWFTRVENNAAYATALARLAARPAWPALKEALDDYEERPAQVLRLAPTPRSALR